MISRIIGNRIAVEKEVACFYHEGKIDEYFESAVEALYCTPGGLLCVAVFAHTKFGVYLVDFPVSAVRFL